MGKFVHKLWIGKRKTGLGRRQRLAVIAGLSVRVELTSIRHVTWAGDLTQNFLRDSNDTEIMTKKFNILVDPKTDVMSLEICQAVAYNEK